MERWGRSTSDARALGMPGRASGTCDDAAQPVYVSEVRYPDRRDRASALEWSAGDDARGDGSVRPLVDQDE